MHEKAEEEQTFAILRVANVSTWLMKICTIGLLTKMVARTVGIIIPCCHIFSVFIELNDCVSINLQPNEPQHREPNREAGRSLAAATTLSLGRLHVATDDDLARCILLAGGGTHAGLDLRRHCEERLCVSMCVYAWKCV